MRASCIKWLFGACVLLLLFCACKKSGGPADSPGSGSNETRVITGWTNFSGGTDTYKYDSKDRLIKYDYNSTTVLYNYSDTTVREDSYSKPTGTLTGSILYQLNAQGLAGSMIVSQSDLLKESYLYEYNADGYLMKRTYIYLDNNTKWWTGSESRYYRTNNVIDSMYYFENTLDKTGNIIQSHFRERQYFQYYTDKKTTIDNPDFGMAFLGRLHQFPLKMIVRQFPGYANDTIRYSYTYDAKKNITQLVLDETPQNRLVFNYSYR